MQVKAFIYILLICVFSNCSDNGLKYEYVNNPTKLELLQAKIKNKKNRMIVGSTLTLNDDNSFDYYTCGKSHVYGTWSYTQDTLFFETSDAEKYQGFFPSFLIKKNKKLVGVAYGEKRNSILIFREKEKNK